MNRFTLWRLRGDPQADDHASTTSIRFRFRAQWQYAKSLTHVHCTTHDLTAAIRESIGSNTSSNPCVRGTGPRAGRTSTTKMTRAGQLTEIDDTLGATNVVHALHVSDGVVNRWLRYFVHQTSVYFHVLYVSFYWPFFFKFLLTRFDITFDVVVPSRYPSGRSYLLPYFSSYTHLNSDVPNRQRSKVASKKYVNFPRYSRTSLASAVYTGLHGVCWWRKRIVYIILIDRRVRAGANVYSTSKYTSDIYACV